MKKLFQVLKQCMSDGEDVVLVTVLSSSGSTPRGAGARMLVNRKGRLCGTIGGGMVEFKAQQLAVEALKEKKSQVKGYKLSPNQVEDLGMICGGNVVIYLQFISAGDHKTYLLVECILSAFDKDEDSWIVTDITDEAAWSMGIYSRSRGIVGIEMDVNGARPLFAKRAVQMKIGEKRYYSEPLMRAGKVIVCGGGHVARELVPVLAHIDFRCTVLDDRGEFADKKLFPMADEVKIVNFQNLQQSIDIMEYDYIVIVTRGHNNDFAVAEQVLRTNAGYIGMIGSKRKIAGVNAKLLEAGIAQKDIDRIYTPIGIDIKAETPAEIAISIAAELIMVRAQRKE